MNSSAVAPRSITHNVRGFHYRYLKRAPSHIHRIELLFMNPTNHLVTCGICHNTVVYDCEVLTNCDHTFCIRCIMIQCNSRKKRRKLKTCRVCSSMVTSYRMTMYDDLEDMLYEIPECYLEDATTPAGYASLRVEIPCYTYNYHRIKYEFLDGIGQDIIKWIWHPKNMHKWGPDHWDLMDDNEEEE